MPDATPRKGRPPKSDIETVIPRILAAATEVFLQAGYDKANMSDVARQAGCSKKTLYIRFPSKLDLFAAVLRFYVEERLQAVRISVMGDEPLERQLASVVTVIRGYVVSEDTYRLHRLMVQDGRRFPELTGIFDNAAWLPASRVIQDLLMSHFAGASEEELSFLSGQFLSLAVLKPLHDNIIGRKAQAEPAERIVRLFLTGCSGYMTAPTK